MRGRDWIRIDEMWWEGISLVNDIALKTRAKNIPGSQQRQREVHDPLLGATINVQTLYIKKL